MSAIVLVLVLIAPDTDVDLPIDGHRLLQDPPLMPVLHNASEVLVIAHEVPQVTRRRTEGALLDQPEGEVRVRARHGTVEGLVLIDDREELAAI